MEKLSIVLILLTSILGSYAQTQLPNGDGSGCPNLCIGKEKVTKIRFYIQDLVGGDNRTVWKVAKTNFSDILPSGFGTVALLDNLVTSGPEIDSKDVGRIQGLIGFADFHEMSLTMLLNLVFTGGDYKGSTISILGRNPLNDEVREVPIVGGTGVFRMARGYVITRTYYVDDANDYGIYQYDAVVYHLDDITLLSRE